MVFNSTFLVALDRQNRHAMNERTDYDYLRVAAFLLGPKERFPLPRWVPIIKIIKIIVVVVVIIIVMIASCEYHIKSQIIILVCKIIFIIVYSILFA